MSDDKSETKKAGNSPSYIAYQVRERAEHGIWTRIGVALEHGDGRGHTIQVDAVPPDGRIHLRFPTERKE